MLSVNVNEQGFERTVISVICWKNYIHIKGCVERTQPFTNTHVQRTCPFGDKVNCLILSLTAPITNCTCGWNHPVKGRLYGQAQFLWDQCGCKLEFLEKTSEKIWGICMYRYAIKTLLNFIWKNKEKIAYMCVI
jgi:hypothetical protein